MLHNLITDIGEYLIHLNLDDVIQFEDSLKSYRDLKDYRSLFLSKEWILAYCKIYNPKEFIFVKSLHNEMDYFVLEVTNDDVHFLGDPFNDYNYVNIPQNDLVEILLLIKSLTKKRIIINCFPITLSIPYSSYRIDCGLHWCSNGNLDVISSKVLRMYKREKSNVVFTRVEPSSEKFKKLLNKLLEERIKILKVKSIDGNDSSVNDTFSSFIKTLCSDSDISNNMHIDYGLCGDKIVSIGLNFRHGSNILYYLRWCYHASNRCSYGLIHDIENMQINRILGFRIIDFARGNESYKYRLGLIEYNLYNYEI